MFHRGPDDSGAYFSGPVGLAARRLSIIDLETGNQPIHNEDRSIWVVHNGEIYNFEGLRKDLESHGHQFYTHSDTEVLVHSYEEFGLDFLQSLKGMFAFALWDERKQILLLARDRMGEKPLHYYATNQEVVFGSELKSVLQHPDVPRNVDHSALSRYLTFQYVPAPQTIFQDVRKLKPGHYLIVSPQQEQLRERQYWDIPAPANTRPLPAMASVGKELLELLRASVKAQLVGNVPVGVLMSGGIDSTLVAALAAEANPGIQAFTMAFEEPTFDESKQAQRVAQRIGCRHHIEVCREGDLLDVLPNITALLDEPLADASILPTYLLARFAAKSVKVALGGDGGDELFAGYPTFQAIRYRSAFRALPKFVRGAIARGVDQLPVSHAYLSLDFKLRQFLRGVDSTPECDFFHWMGAFTEAEKELLLGREQPPPLTPVNLFEDIAASPRFDSDLERCLYLCAKHYLQDGVLVKVDRASMANSLEVRAPFLDRDLVEFAARCPLEYKMTLLQTKLILRDAARAILPGEILWGKKRGFAPPIGKWLSGGLKDFTRDTLNSERIRREGFFEGKYVQRLLDDHLAGRKNNSRLLWTLLVFQLWKDQVTRSSISN